MSEGGNHDGHICLREEIMMSPMSEGGNHNGHLCLREEIMMSPMSEEEIMMVTYV